MKHSIAWWALAAFVLVAALYSANAKAEEVSLFAGAWSKHIGSDYDYNEQHDLAAIQYGSVFAGYFKNSYSEDSFALGYSFDRKHGPFKAGVYVGATYGYRDCIKGWDDSSKNLCPMVVPYVTWDAGPVNPQLMLMGNAVAVAVRIGL